MESITARAPKKTQISATTVPFTHAEMKIATEVPRLEDDDVEQVGSCRYRATRMRSPCERTAMREDEYCIVHAFPDQLYEHCENEHQEPHSRWCEDCQDVVTEAYNREEQRSFDRRILILESSYEEPDDDPLDDIRDVE